jgi:hypothetical protein
MSEPIDVNVADLADWTQGPLSSLFQEIKQQWVGEHPDRMQHPRCGTVYYSNRDGLGEVRLVLRFPLRQAMNVPTEVGLYDLVND